MVRLWMLLNHCVYITAVGCVPPKAIPKSQDYHAPQARHSRWEEMQAVTALPQGCCFAGIPVVPPDSCEHLCLVLQHHMPPQGLHGAFNPPRQRLLEDSWDFLEALAGFKFVSTLHFTKYDTAKVFFLPVPTILIPRFFSGVVNSIANFPEQDSFTLEKLKAEHVESPNLAF